MTFKRLEAEPARRRALLLIFFKLGGDDGWFVPQSSPPINTISEWLGPLS